MSHSSFTRRHIWVAMHSRFALVNVSKHNPKGQRFKSASFHFKLFFLYINVAALMQQVTYYGHQVLESNHHGKCCGMSCSISEKQSWFNVGGKWIPWHNDEFQDCSKMWAMLLQTCSQYLHQTLNVLKYLQIFIFFGLPSSILHLSMQLIKFRPQCFKDCSHFC